MLAIGIQFDHEGFAASRDTNSRDPQTVSNHLTSEFGCVFDQILIVENDEVIHHWNIDRDYT